MLQDKENLKRPNEHDGNYYNLYIFKTTSNSCFVMPLQLTITYWCIHLTFYQKAPFSAIMNPHVWNPAFFHFLFR